MTEGDLWAMRGDVAPEVVVARASISLAVSVAWYVSPFGLRSRSFLISLGCV